MILYQYIYNTVSHYFNISKSVHLDLANIGVLIILKFFAVFDLFDKVVLFIAVDPVLIQAFYFCFGNPSVLLSSFRVPKVVFKNNTVYNQNWNCIPPTLHLVLGL